MINLRAYLSGLHADMAARGRRRNAKALREVIAALDELKELRERCAMMEMEAEWKDQRKRA